MFQRLRATFAASISRDERTDEAASTAEVVFFFARFGGSFSEDLDLVDEPAREASKTSMASSSPLAPRDDSRTARSGAASVAETRFRFFPASAPRPDSTGAVGRGFGREGDGRERVRRRGPAHVDHMVFTAPRPDIGREVALQREPDSAGRRPVRLRTVHEPRVMQ